MLISMEYEENALKIVNYRRRWNVELNSRIREIYPQIFNYIYRKQAKDVPVKAI